VLLVFKVDQDFKDGKALKAHKELDLKELKGGLV
jgi:hypothetical protein